MASHFHHQIVEILLGMRAVTILAAALFLIRQHGFKRMWTQGRFCFFQGISNQYGTNVLIVLLSNIRIDYFSELFEFYQMKPLVKEVNAIGLANKVKDLLDVREGARFGLLTSIDGKQLVTLLLDSEANSAECWISEVIDNTYKTLTTLVPQSHWFERSIYDLFGLVLEQHPRLKHIFLHDEYEPTFHPLSWQENKKNDFHQQKLPILKEALSQEKLASTYYELWGNGFLNPAE